MLRYRADRRTLLVVAIYFALAAVPWVARPLAGWVKVPLFVLVCALSFLGAAITHNTVHTPVFQSRTLNRIFQVALTLTYGNPVSSFVPGHNLSHHLHMQSRRDVMRTSKTRHRLHLLNGLFFAVHVGGAIMKGDGRYFRAMFRKNPAWARQMALEWVALHAAYLALCLVDWRTFLVFVFLPHKYAAWGIITMNLLQHDGCDDASDYNHSRNFAGKLVNYLTFNNGFHTIHHLEPALHWSLLPAAHAARVEPLVDPRLVEPSLPAYLWRTFFWPGKRLRYDGTPVVLPPEEPDEEWVPSPRETPADVSLGAMG